MGGFIRMKSLLFFNILWCFLLCQWSMGIQWLILGILHLELICAFRSSWVLPWDFCHFSVVVSNVEQISLNAKGVSELWAYHLGFKWGTSFESRQYWFENMIKMSLVSFCQRKYDILWPSGSYSQASKQPKLMRRLTQTLLF